MNKQLIDKAVEANEGIFPGEGDSFRFSIIGICIYREEFELRAKELGWVSGFKWGVEYPTNGKKPDLDDDIIISWKDKFGLGSTCKAGILNYQFGTIYEVVSFAVTDIRYKPKGPELNSKPHKDDWFLRGELPPAGVECEVLNSALDNAEWEKCVVKFIGDLVCVYTSESCNERCAYLDFIKFRPIKTEREKFVDAALAVMQTNRISNTQRKTINRLYDAGFKAPDEKSSK